MNDVNLLKRLKIKRMVLVFFILWMPLSLSADFMDKEWAELVCQTWNENDVLGRELGLLPSDGVVGTQWIANDGGRGYKVIQLYRTECGAASKVQLTIINKGDNAFCQYGGRPDGKILDIEMDYIMHASDSDWDCIINAKWGCGAMGAIISGKLKLEGPKLEVMNTVEPFARFLRLLGTVKGDKKACGEQD